MIGTLALDRCFHSIPIYMPSNHKPNGILTWKYSNPCMIYIYEMVTIFGSKIAIYPHQCCLNLFNFCLLGIGIYMVVCIYGWPLKSIKVEHMTDDDVYWRVNIIRPNSNNLELYKLNPITVLDFRWSLKGIDDG